MAATKTPTYCETCGALLVQKPKGRPRRFCDVTCRTSKHRGAPRANGLTRHGPPAPVILARRHDAVAAAMCDWS